ncbi:MAG: zinc dependent phospholipase C family protein [Oscillospiraceae bacterium]|nr:zinc dependent phospholipase C family protein [Oscillospiraceae bacterium]
MPAAYAHYTFGRKVFQQLPEPIRNLIGRSALHKKVFAIGLQGPDILFHYHPWHKNRLNSTGNRIHHEPAAQFLEPARAAMGDPPNETLLCYLLGFVCHFVLDSQCHPFITKYKTQENVPHYGIESEFDRMLMLEDGKDPLTFNPAAYLKPDPESCTVIAQAYGVSPQQISDALGGMFLIRDVFTGRTAPKRAIVGGISGMTSLKGLALPAEPDERCQASNEELHWLYDAAVREGAAMVQEFYQLAYNGASLPSRFQRNFE